MDEGSILSNSARNPRNAKFFHHIAREKGNIVRFLLRLKSLRDDVCAKSTTSFGARPIFMVRREISDKEAMRSIIKELDDSISNDTSTLVEKLPDGRNKADEGIGIFQLEYQ